MELIFVINGLLKAVIFNHPKLLKVHQERSKQSNEYFQLLLAYICNRDNLRSS